MASRVGGDGRRQLQALVRLRTEHRRLGPTVHRPSSARATAARLSSETLLGRIDRRSELTTGAAPTRYGGFQYLVDRIESELAQRMCHRSSKLWAMEVLKTDSCSCLTAQPNGSRLSCGALKKDSFLNLRAPPASSAC